MEFRRHLSKLTHAVAEKIDARDADPLQLRNRRHVDLSGKQVADEQMDGLALHLPANVGEGGIPGSCPPCLDFRTARIGQPLRPIDGRHLQDLVPRLLKAADEVRPPELIGRNRMAAAALLATDENSHAALVVLARRIMNQVPGSRCGTVKPKRFASAASCPSLNPSWHSMHMASTRSSQPQSRANSAAS